MPMETPIKKNRGDGQVLYSTLLLQGVALKWFRWKSLADSSLVSMHNYLFYSYSYISVYET